MKLLYFGCATDSGHYLHDGEWNYISRANKVIPFGWNIDGEFPPRRPPLHSRMEGAQAPEGEAKLTHKDGWTALAWWDNSVDGRPGSHTTFLAEGTFTFDEMITEARSKYPTVMSRQRRLVFLP